MDMHTNKRTNRPAWTGTHGHKHKVDWHAHMNTHARPLLPAQGPGQNRVNPCAAGGGNPMQVTHSKECGEVEGWQNRGCWLLVSWTWVGLHIGSYLTLTCRAFQIRGVSKFTFTGISRLALFSSAHGNSDAEVYSLLYKFMGVYLNKQATASCKGCDFHADLCPSKHHWKWYK